MLERILLKIAKKWVSGSTHEDALSSARICNNKGISAILNFLGEDTIDKRAIEQTVKEYFTLLGLLKSNTINGCISVKPTQIGLRVGYNECLYNFRQIVRKAKSLDEFIWIDIESFQFVEDTIAIYLELIKDYKKIGVALQSYLKRSASDLVHLLEQGANIRIVKGAYKENESVAFQSMENINSNFSKLMKLFFENSSTNSLLAVATHDSRLIDHAIELSHLLGTNKEQFEFQLLMGIHDELKKSLIQRGFKVCEYIPYGNQWIPYSIRRIRERKRNILLLTRSIMPF